MEESRASSTVVKRSWDAANCSRTLLVSVMLVMDVILPAVCIRQGQHIQAHVDEAVGPIKRQSHTPQTTSLPSCALVLSNSRNGVMR